MTCIQSSLTLRAIVVADPGFWHRGVKFDKFRPKPQMLCNVTIGGRYNRRLYTLHEMIEINVTYEN